MTRPFSIISLWLVLILGHSPASTQGHVMQPEKIPVVTLTTADSSSSRQYLRQQLDALFTSKYLRTASVSAMVTSLRTGQVIYERNATTCLTPASTTKLFSTASLYHHLAPKLNIRTEIRSDGTVDSRGTLHGNLYLVGIGDALLSVNDIEQAADAIGEAGIRHVTGSVYGDASRFDRVFERSVYSGDGEVVEALPPITALTVNRNTVTIVVNGAANGTISAQCIPSSDAFAVVVQQTAKGKKGPRRSKVHVGSSVLPNGTQQFVVSGWPGANKTVTAYSVMSRPAIAAAGILKSRLRSGGVDVDGDVGEKSAPAGSTVVEAIERPVEEFCSIVNKRSDNFLAEQVFKMVGALNKSADRSANTATRARSGVLECLDSLNVYHNGCVLNDGSGLSRRNKVCAKTEVGLLKAIWAEPWGKSFRSTLAIAGVDGTLRRRMLRSPAERNVQAKTGTLRGTSALAGYVHTMDGEPFVFSFIENGQSVGAFKAVENQAAIALASFSYRKAPANVPPAPNAADDIVDDSSAIDDEIIESVKTAPARQKTVAPPVAKPVVKPAIRKPAVARPTARRPVVKKAPAKRTSVRKTSAVQKRSKALPKPRKKKKR